MLEVEEEEEEERGGGVLSRIISECDGCELVGEARR